MSFAINPSFTHIDIPAVNILEIYRSKDQIRLTEGKFRGHPCEAFICIYRVEKTVSAHVAILETAVNSIFVYTSDFSVEQSTEYPKVLEEAQNFTASFGFSMEKVNLEFSQAMREVIIKGLKVMKPPLKRPALRSIRIPEQGNLEILVPATTSSADVTNSASADPATLLKLKTELSSTQLLVEKINREKSTQEQNASREIANLRAAVEKAEESEKSCEERLLKEIESLKAAKLATDTRQHDDRIKQLEAALHKANSAGKTLTDENSRLAAKIKIVENEKLRLEEVRATEKNSSAKEILKLTAEIDSINTLLAAEKIAGSAAAEKIAALTLFETSLQESQQREEDLCRNLDLLKEEIDRLEAELDKLLQQKVGEDVLLEKIAELEKEVANSKTEKERLSSFAPDIAALELELQDLTKAKDDVEAEYLRMANESLEKEAEMIEVLYGADAEIVRLSRELELQQQVAEMEKAALRDELKRMMTSVAVSQFAAPPVRSIELPAAPTATILPPVVQSSQPVNAPLEDVPIVPGPPPQAAVATTPTAPPAAPPPETIDELAEEEDTPDGPVSGDPQITAGLVNEFGSFCGSSSHSTTEFTIAPGIDKIEYSELGEIVAILYASNSVQAVPDGSSIQRCKGYVIATKKSGKYSVYVAWYLTDSGKVVICTPEQQPADAAECTQIILDAVSYFEIVGFMMEVEDLGSTIKSYNRAIRNVPALVRK